MKIKIKRNPEFSTSIPLPSNKETTFKLGFLFGLRDGYQYFTDRLKIKNWMEKLDEILDTFNLNSDRINGQIFFRSVENLNIQDIFEAGRYYGIKKAVNRASFIDNFSKIQTQISAIDGLIDNYRKNYKLPEIRILEML